MLLFKRANRFGGSRKKGQKKKKHSFTCVPKKKNQKRGSEQDAHLQLNVHGRNNNKNANALLLWLSVLCASIFVCFTLPLLFIIKTF